MEYMKNSTQCSFSIYHECRSSPLKVDFQCLSMEEKVIVAVVTAAPTSTASDVCGVSSLVVVSRLVYKVGQNVGKVN